MTHLARTLVLTALALGLGATGAFAQQTATATAAPVSQATTLTTSTQAATKPDAAIKAGDRDCIRNTGSRILNRSDKCLPVAGRSYSGKELRSTGQIDTGRALQMLDPSITVNRW